MASTIQVILTKDVHNLGRAGELVNVRPGYGRNFLLPRGLALLATRGNVAQLEHHRRAIAAEQARVRAEHEALAKQLAGVSVAIARQAGDDGKLFGSVTSRDVAEALAGQNIAVDRRFIQLDDPIKQVGAVEVPVRFAADLVATVKVNVVAVQGKR